MNDNLSKALSIFIEAMRPFVVGFLLEKFKNEPWEGVFFARLKPDKQNTWNKACLFSRYPQIVTVSNW